MSRVVSSNFNSLADAVESPSQSVELALEEMSRHVRGAREEVVLRVAAEKQLRNKVAELDEKIATWTRRAELAVQHDDDGLAREALKHKQRLLQERERAEQLRGEQRSGAVELKRELERMEGKLEELKARRAELISRAQAAKATDTGAPTGTGGKAFSEFRRMEDQIEGVDAALQAQREVDEALGLEKGPGGLSNSEVEARFRALESGQSTGPADEVRPEIDAELQAIKRRVRVGQ